MDFKVNNTNFCATYVVHGKQTSNEPDKVYCEALNTTKKQKDVAVQAQKYLASDKAQSYIKQLPQDSFVRLNTGVLDGEEKTDDKILNYTPFIAYQTKTIGEQAKVTQKLGAQGDRLELSLDKDNKLDTKKVDNWFENLIGYYKS